MVTIKDIARAAGVTHATVSYVLNGKSRQARIGEGTRERIQALADEMGYQRNELARSMVTGRNEVLAFVAMNVGTWEHTGRILSGVMKEATGRGFALKVFQLGDADEREDIVRQLVSQRVAGVIFHFNRHDAFAVVQEKMVRRGIPCATVNLSNVGGGVGVTSDDFQGIEDIVGYLVGLGHRRLAYFGKRIDTEYSENRRNGYLSGARKYLPGSEPALAEDIDRLFAGMPSGVVCVGDSAACDVLRAAWRKGIKVPEELSIAGFGDLGVAKNAVVPLTTLAQPFERMGREAAAALLDTIEGTRRGVRGGSENRKLPVSLVVRDSTASPRQRKRRKEQEERKYHDIAAETK